MSHISIGAAARSSLHSLQDIAAQMTRVQARLATGKRVNSPIEGPSAYFTAATLRSRAATLDGLMDGIFNAQKTIEAANAGIASIESLLNSAKSLANQALQSADTLVTVTGTNTTPLTASTQIASPSGSATMFRAGDEVSVSDGTTTAIYTAVNGDTVQDVLDAINNTVNLKVDAGLNASGQIVLTATDTVDVTVSATINGAGGATLNSVSGLTAGTTEFQINTTRQTLAAQFDDVLEQIDQVAQDAGYNGVNLLAHDNLSVVFNETGTSSATIEGGQFGAADLGVNASAGQFQVDSAINSAVTAVEAALTRIEAEAAVFESNAAVISMRQDFTQSLSNTLTAGADNLVLSDPNEDAALLLALQTRQQMAAATLSLSNGASLSVLRLFD